jgi:hypothetical protein
MIETTKQMLANQIDAALRMLDACIDRCPDSAWDAPVCDLAFCQAVFHALFFADCYLGPDTESTRHQPFHRDHPQFFRDYEELQDKKQELLYDRPTIKKYVEHCRSKAAKVIATETPETFAAPCGFPWLKFSRAELYVYNIRHVQHHAAQLSLRLRLDSTITIPWAK